MTGSRVGDCPSGFSLPEGLRLRPARPDETEAVARAHWEIRTEVLDRIWPREVVRRRSFEERLAGWHALLSAPDFGTSRIALVLEVPGREIAGLVSAGPAREDLGPWTGQLYQLYLREGIRGLGIGRRLLGEVRGFLLAAGHARFYLWTAGQNAASRGFYERCGGRLLREEPLPPHPTATRVAYGYE